MRRQSVKLLIVATMASLLVACSTRQPSKREYTEYTETLLALGDLRTDTAPADAPYTNADLVRNFSRIALRHERDIARAGSEENADPNPLQRWAGQVRYKLIGAGAAPEDHFEVHRLMGKLASLTGLTITPADDELNFLIFITEPGERRETAETLHSVHPSLGASFDTWRRSADIVCMATNLFSREDPNEIVFGMVSIGSEVEGILRRSCLHEEIVQAFGLGNDDPAVRPSIFNDDEEFALLTEHDEFLLRVLYDPRLRPGMTEAEASPIVERIVAELRPAGG